MTSVHDHILSTLKHDLDVLRIPEQARLPWLFQNFRTGTQHQGLRLTRSGQQLMRNYFDHWQFDLVDKPGMDVLVCLDRYQSWPYYINSTRIVLYSSTDASMFRLYGNDLQQYISDLKEQ